MLEPVVPSVPVEVLPERRGLEHGSVLAVVAHDADGRMADRGIIEVSEGVQVSHISPAP